MSDQMPEKMTETPEPAKFKYDDPYYTVTRLIRGIEFLESAFKERMAVEGGHAEPIGCISMIITTMGRELSTVEQALRDRRFLINEKQLALTWDFDHIDMADWRTWVEAAMEARRRARIQRNPTPINKRAVQGLGGPGKTATEKANGVLARRIENQQKRRDDNMAHQKGKTGEVKATGGKKRK